jgi:hypothetical protein
MSEQEPGTVVSVDDFQEFIHSAYDSLLAEFAEAGLTGTIEPGSVGHYLLVARPADEREVASCVEVTGNDKPLPADPDDVTVWVLTRGTERVTVPASAGVDALVATVAGLLTV